MLSVGELIWASSRPLIRLVLCVTCGFVITKTDNFPPIAARGAGQVMLNIALPCLMFSKIVPAFTSDNIGALGPLVLVAVLYEVMGIMVAWMVKQFFWVPHRFRYGILVAGGWGNVGDIPTSVIMSITGASPFDSEKDQTLAVAYISAFILVFMITMFPMGANRWVAMDYVGPDVEPDEVREAIRVKRKMILYGWPRLISQLIRRKSESKLQEDDVRLNEAGFISEKNELDDRNSKEGRTLTSRGRHVAFYDDATTVVPTEGPRSPVCSPAPTEVGARSRLTSPEPAETLLRSQTQPSETQLYPVVLPTTAGSTDPLNTPKKPQRRTVILSHIRTFYKSLVAPASLAIILSFPIALIPQLKALFVDVPGVHISPAPDGHPPLAFFIDTTSFIGAASVPLGLICLGSALARLNVPKNNWNSLPLGAISFLAIGKMVLTPVLGVLMVKGLTNVGLIPAEDKVLRFVCIFFSCLPTATTQVFLTQVYSGTGEAEHLSPFLIPQYILMFVSMTALSAYTLHLLF
ncbi:auxin efflux carrier transmembrane protein [Collybia nuda]|uniref:Auxin efflux carrier transmembrane protein n=1 Tax=Collybia nuda TaxID=64659 RepID=A0A9P5XUA3_9AGAR|nr:auxin efflux carrier transmembrane protein [Collybia nuda]